MFTVEPRVFRIQTQSDPYKNVEIVKIGEKLNIKQSRFLTIMYTLTINKTLHIF